MRWKAGRDELDASMLMLPLPPDAVDALTQWLSGDGVAYSGGTGAHQVLYVPSAWSGIQPWPTVLADRRRPGTANLSRAQVVQAVRTSAAVSNWTEALVATYVWGQGDNGYGPYRLKALLQHEELEALLRDASATLADLGAVEAYQSLRGAISGWGPAFYTKFLYFAGAALQDPAGPAPLILDQRIARRLRAHATQVATHLGLEEPATLARWLWSNTGWTAHRYAVYLEWMHSAAARLASSGGWPMTPDLLELALFSGAWQPAPR